MELIGCSNPGFSYTKNTINNIVELNKWIKSSAGLSPMTYKEMQGSIEQQKGNLDGSAIRMIIPFLRKAGVVKDELFEHAGNKIDFKDIFTEYGKCFMKYVDIYSQLRNEEDQEIESKLAGIFEKYVLIQYSYLIQKSQKVYGGIIQFLHKYRTIDKNEFFMLTTILENGEQVGSSRKLVNMVKSYRNNEIDNDNIEVTKNVNAYGYIMAFLRLYNIVIENNGVFRLNPKYENIFNEFLGEDKDDE